MKLSKTKAENSYKYSWLLNRIYPYIKPVIPRVILGFLIAIPLGLLDSVTAFILKPYMDFVVGQKDCAFTILGHNFTLHWQTFALIIPFGVIAFAVFQGVLRYLNTYISEWTSKKVTNSVKIDLFKHLVQMDTKFERPANRSRRTYRQNQDEGNKHLRSFRSNLRYALQFVETCTCRRRYSLRCLCSSSNYPKSH